MAFADIRVFLLPNGPGIMAESTPADALSAQGFEATKAQDNQTMTFTNGSPTVTFGGAAGADDEGFLIDSEERKVYGIASVALGSAYTLDRNYEGATGSKAAHVVRSGIRAPYMNPPQIVLAGDGS